MDGREGEGERQELGRDRKVTGGGKDNSDEGWSHEKNE